MDEVGHHRVDDLVLHARGFFGGRGGNGCQLAIVRTQLHGRDEPPKWEAAESDDSRKSLVRPPLTLSGRQLDSELGLPLTALRGGRKPAQ
jgi:hypothetical protein